MDLSICNTNQVGLSLYGEYQKILIPFELQSYRQRYQTCNLLDKGQRRSKKVNRLTQLSSTVLGCNVYFTKLQKTVNLMIMKVKSMHSKPGHHHHTQTTQPLILCCISNNNKKLVSTFIHLEISPMNMMENNTSTFVRSMPPTFTGNE